MKCAYCGKSLTNFNVVYKLATEELMEAVVKHVTTAESLDDSALMEENASIMGGMGDSEDDLFGTASNATSGASGYISGRDLEEKHHATAILEKINVSQKHRRENENHEVEEPLAILKEDLCIGYTVEDITINGTTYASATLKKRRCGYCHKLLPRLSGMMPTYLVMMAGHSTAGKTLFLLGQEMLLYKKFPIFEGDVFTNVQINDGISHFEMGEADFIDEKHTEYIKNKTIPDTTTETPLPHCVRFAYRRTGNDVNGEKITSVQSECLVVFQDVMGELATVRNDDRKMEMIEKAKLADAYLIAMDSSILMGEIPGVNRSSEDPEILLREMSNTFGQYDGSESKPSVVALTKVDLILKHKDALNMPDIDLSNPALSTETKFCGDMPNWKKLFLDKMHNETMALLERLPCGQTWYNMLDAPFPNAKYMAVSTYGYDTKVEEVDMGGKTIKMIRNIQPLHVEAPMLYLLMEFGVLPPMHKNAFVENSAEMYERWYDDFCQNPVLPEHRKMMKRQKKPGLLRRIFGRGGGKK
jgi:hypothetical protein